VRLRYEPHNAPPPNTAAATAVAATASLAYQCLMVVPL
jgi:hypothetical protein